MIAWDNIISGVSALGSILSIMIVWHGMRSVKKSNAKNAEAINKKLDDFKGELIKEVDQLNRALGIIYDRTKTFVVAVAHKFPALKGDNLFTASYPEISKPTFVANSPVNLNDRGKEVADKLEARATTRKLLSKVMKRIPENPLLMDVQGICFDYALKELMGDVDEDLRRKMDRHIYEEGGDPTNTLMVFGIMLRNAAMKKLGLDDLCREG